jgi:ribosomal protein L37AE/L43A
MSTWPGMQYCKCPDCGTTSVKMDTAPGPFFHCQKCDKVVAEETQVKSLDTSRAQKVAKMVARMKSAAGSSSSKFPY